MLIINIQILHRSPPLNMNHYFIHWWVSDHKVQFVTYIQLSFLCEIIPATYKIHLFLLCSLLNLAVIRDFLIYIIYNYSPFSSTKIAVDYMDRKLLNKGHKFNKFLLITLGKTDIQCHINNALTNT